MTGSLPLSAKGPLGIEEGVCSRILDANILTSSPTILGASITSAFYKSAPSIRFRAKSPAH